MRQIVELDENEAVDEILPVDLTNAIDDQIEEDLMILKTIVCSDENAEEIKRVIKSTAKHRTEMSKTPEMDFLENFPIFFTNPEFVSKINLFVIFFFSIIQFMSFSYRFCMTFRSATLKAVQVECWRNGQSTVK